MTVRQRHVLHNPASGIGLPRAGRRLPRPALTAAEAELVLAQPDLADPVGAGVRPRLAAGDDDGTLFLTAGGEPFSLDRLTRLPPATSGPPGAQGRCGAAEEVRALNHATRPGAGGLAFPAGAYDVTGSLAMLAARLPQVMARLLAFLQAEAAAGQLVVVAGEHAGDPAAMLTAVTADLDAAVAAARRPHQALDAAQNTLTWVAAAEPGEQ